MTERQMDILYYLHAQDDFVPVSDISVALQVSVKTIRNELLIIQEVIKKESLGTLEKKPRLGIKLVIEAEVWESYTRQLESKGLTAEEADEKSLLIYYLLTKGQINYTEIQKYLYMGRSAAERLIPEVEKWLKSQENYELIKEKDYISYPKPNGYRGIHLIMRVRSGEASGTYVEIQLRTIAMDFWASLEHQLKYKKEIGHAAMMGGELKQCADEIASVDLSMQTIRDIIQPEE